MAKVATRTGSPWPVQEIESKLNSRLCKRDGCQLEKVAAIRRKCFPMALGIWFKEVDER